MSNSVMERAKSESLPNKKSFLRKTAYLALALILLVFISITAISTYIGWSLTHPDRKPIDDNPANYGLVYNDVTFNSNDNEVALSGWWIDAEQNQISSQNKTIIFAHGYHGNRLQKKVPTLELSKVLVDKGYNILLFDFRNSGLSEGDLTTVGVKEKEDLLGAIEYVKNLSPNTEIILFGFSMGASTSLITAVESPDVAAVIADSPFDDLTTYLESNLSVWSHLPNFPFTPMIMNIIPPLTGMDPEKVSPLKTIHLFGDKPLLLIHADEDPSIPLANSERILSASGNPNASLWTVPGTEHVGARNVDSKAYDEKVLEFLSTLK
jgi:pimeloyl-ACP methyl ester carboxylesterase